MYPKGCVCLFRLNIELKQCSIFECILYTQNADMTDLFMCTNPITKQNNCHKHPPKAHQWPMLTINTGIPH